MAKNVSLLGADYPDVPSVILPQTGGGNALFTDVSDTTALAADVLSGKYFYDAFGVRTAGTGSGGGSGGLEYESGTYTPATDIAKPTISFQKQHSKSPFFAMFVDVKGTSDTTNATNYTFYLVDWYRMTGVGIPHDASTFYYGFYRCDWRNTSATSLNNSASLFSNTSDDTGTTYAFPCYFVTNTELKPSSGSSASRYWRSGRTYKWIAVWNPT